MKYLIVNIVCDNPYGTDQWNTVAPSESGNTGTTDDSLGSYVFISCLLEPTFIPNLYIIRTNEFIKAEFKIKPENSQNLPKYQLK